MKNSKGIVLIIAGPTASGKTELSLRIASRISAEIVSADSRQIFRFMDIGTAKATAAERAAVPHHCIDICHPDAYFSAGMYAETARNVIAQIQARHHLPLVVGGSGLYIRALTDGVFQGNYRDATVRQAIVDQASESGWAPLYEKLCRIDPQTAAVVHSNDHKRIIRALEVYELTGQPISVLQRVETVPADFTPLFVGLDWPRDILYQRIERRVDQMIADGLISEVERLLEMGYHSTLNSLDTVGYQEIMAYLSGKLTLEDAVNLMKQNTRHFAKRQLTWFRRDKRIQWLPVTGQLPPEYYAEAVCALLSAGR